MKKNGKRIILYLAFLAVAVLCCATFVSCGMDNVKEVTVTPDVINVRIGEFDYADYTVTATYESGKTVESVLSEDMIAAKDRLKFFQEGQHEIGVTYLGVTATITVNVRQNVFAGAEFNDLDVVYNGEFYTVEVKNVPEGTTVTYPTTNRFRTAGEYQATAILQKDAYEIKEMTAKVTIRKADYDLSEVTFEDKTEDYDGSTHVLELTGTLPTGLYVDYTITREGGREEKGNSATNAGAYLVEARFSGDTVNYNAVETKQATLTVRQATVDVSGLVFEDKTVVYDRTKQTLALEGNLPRGVSVEYLNNGHVDAGVYEVTAVFSVADTVNYAEIPAKVATLTIEKADYDMSAVHFDGTKVTYDGEEHKIEIKGQLPNGVSVSYEGNEGTDAGSYEATARFTSNNVNYKDPVSMTATLIIDPAVAQMDQIVFERRRFISVVQEKGLQYDDDDPEAYNPYRVANEYRPENVPVGFEMTVTYKKTDDWQTDLASDDATGFVDRITEDGYYVVKIVFDGGKNYVDDKPTVKTVIRVDTIDNDDVTTWEQLVFDDQWVNPETGNATGVFMDYYTGACTDPAHRKTVTIDGVTLQYCDCNVFLNYAAEGESALAVDPTQDRYISEAKLEDYRALAEAFGTFRGYDLPTGEQFQTFLTAAEQAASDPWYSEFGGGSTYSFDLSKAVYIGCGMSSTSVSGSYMIVSDGDGNTSRKYTSEFLAPPQNNLARLFGFENTDDFQRALRGVFSAYRSDAYKNVAATNPLAFEGAVYASYDGGYFYIFPYALYVTETDTEFVFFFCGGISGSVATYCGILLSDAQLMADLFENPPADDEALLLEGRCLISELYMTDDGVLYRTTPMTKTVISAGNPDVLKPITDGKDLVFAEKNGATEHLIYGDFEIYRFLPALPGNCAETSEGYDPDEYKIATDTTVYTFCDDDVFATVIKANGDASGITRRNARADHPQMTSEVAEKFDELSVLYRAFLSNYVTGEDVVNEWKIGVSNKNYEAYKAFFEYASDMMAKSNRNMGKGADYVLNRSVIIGLNRAFSISVGSSGYNYKVDDYRLAVAKLFGFTDLDTFTAYINALADVLVANGKHANVDSISQRLLYDGAILTANGCYVLPYVIKSETSTKQVTLFIFVDGDGAASVWINDAKNAFNATDFGETAWETADKYTVSIVGRCLLFEDDGYIMNEDLGKNVVEMTERLQEYPEYVFHVGGVPENCNETNLDADYFTYMYDLGGHCSELYFRYVSGYDCSGISIWYDDCNPFCLIYGDWIMDDVDALIEHSLLTAPASAVVAFNSLDELFAAFLAHFDLPAAGGTLYIPSVEGDALESYTAFYNAAVALYGYALPAFVGDAANELSGSAVIGLNRPFTMLFGAQADPTVDYQALVANLFGFEDKDEFLYYAGELAALYAQYREDLANSVAVNKALENGCFFTENGSFVFPIAVKSTAGYAVLAYLIIDADDCVSIWINDINAALWATRFDADHCGDTDYGISNSLYCKNMLFLKEIPYEAIFLFCDCDPFSTVQNANGDASEITRRNDRGDHAVMTDEVAGKFDILAALYADLLSRYSVQDGEDNDWKVSVGGDTYAEYRRLFRYARDLFASAENDLGNVDEYLLSGSAIIGMNETFAISSAGNAHAPEEYRLLLMKLFGFTSEEAFEKCVNALANALAANEAGANADTVAGRLIYDGAVRTENGYFVLPYAIKNATSGKTVLAFVFVDGNGTMAVWINNLNDAFALTDFTELNSDDDSPDFVYVSGRCVLFEDNEYVGWNGNGMPKYIAVEKTRSFASAGDFLIYSSFTDEEGFEVYWFSVYGFETEVVYDDSDSGSIGTVNKGFYTMINVAGVEDVHRYNQNVIETYEDYIRSGE